jgi:hypothetical protein
VGKSRGGRQRLGHGNTAMPWVLSWKHGQGRKLANGGHLGHNQHKRVRVYGCACARVCACRRLSQAVPTPGRGGDKHKTRHLVPSTRHTGSPLGWRTPFVVGPAARLGVSPLAAGAGGQQGGHHCPPPHSVALGTRGAVPTGCPPLWLRNRGGSRTPGGSSRARAKQREGCQVASLARRPVQKNSRGKQRPTHRTR